MSSEWCMSLYGAWDRWFMSLNSLHLRLGDEERRLMHLVPAPAVRLMIHGPVTHLTVRTLPLVYFLESHYGERRFQEEEERAVSTRCPLPTCLMTLPFLSFVRTNEKRKGKCLASLGSEYTYSNRHGSIRFSLRIERSMRLRLGTRSLLFLSLPTTGK